MPTEIKVPTLGESVTSATVARWLKKAGEAVAADEPLVELETDKVTVEVNATLAGRAGAAIRGPGGRRGRSGRGARLDRCTRAVPPSPLRPSRRTALRPASARRADPPPRRPARCTRTRGREPPAGVNPPPTGIGPGRPARDTAGRRAGGQSGPRPAAGRRQDDAGASASAPSAQRRRDRQGRPHHQGGRAGLPEPAPAAAPVARARPSRRARRRRRGTREDDPPAPHHRAAAEGGAEHRGHADHLQRGGHDRGHGAAQRIQGRVREEARGRPPRLHVASS